VKKVKALEAALAPLEIIAQDAVKKYIEENLQILIHDHLPAALATHFEAVAENMIDIIVTPPPDVSAPPIIVPVAVSNALIPPLTIA
jgi:hypothetical protein